jgi:hypothetical protein
MDRLTDSGQCGKHESCDPSCRCSNFSYRQALDPANRNLALSGTNTMMNIPPSENTTLDHKINTGLAGGSEVTVGDIMSTTKGPFCYMYV